MNEQKVYVTKEGLKKLKDEYEDLTKNKRKEVAKKIANARDLGDLSENEAWKQAREEQSFIEGRIEELEEILKHAAVIIESHASNGAIALGSKVIVHIDGEEQEFKIVDEPEADPKKNMISHVSPLGKVLLGKKAGDKVEVEAPVGKISYTILKVS